MLCKLCYVNLVKQMEQGFELASPAPTFGVRPSPGIPYLPPLPSPIRRRPVFAAGRGSGGAASFLCISAKTHD